MSVFTHRTVENNIFLHAPKTSSCIVFIILNIFIDSRILSILNQVLISPFASFRFFELYYYCSLTLSHLQRTIGISPSAIKSQFAHLSAQCDTSVNVLSVCAAQNPSWSPAGTVCPRSRSPNAAVAPGQGRGSPRTRATTSAAAKPTQRALISKLITAHTRVGQPPLHQQFVFVFSGGFFGPYQAKLCHMHVGNCRLRHLLHVTRWDSGSLSCERWGDGCWGVVWQVRRNRMILIPAQTETSGCLARPFIM